MPSQMSRQVLDFGRQLLQKGNCRCIDNCMHRIEPQAIHVIVAQPHDRVVTKEPADLITIRTVEIETRSPRGRVPSRKVRAKLRQVVAAGTKMVVYNV